MYMMAKPKHVLKYADLYLTKGFDVISVSCKPAQLMWPAKGSQVFNNIYCTMGKTVTHLRPFYDNFSVTYYCKFLNSKRSFSPPDRQLAMC